MFIKTRTEACIKSGIELAVFVAFRLGVAELILVHRLAVLLVNGPSFVHTVVYDAYNQTHSQEKGIKVLSLSSNRKHMRYGVRSNIFERFPNGMIEAKL